MYFFQIREYICLGAACAQRLWNDLCEHERVIRQVCKCICSEHTFVWAVLCEQTLVNVFENEKEFPHTCIYVTHEKVFAQIRNCIFLGKRMYLYGLCDVSSAQSDAKFLFQLLSSNVQVARLAHWIIIIYKQTCISPNSEKLQF